jgi:PIN domain nuclease of toxin-antitoxin system
MLIAQAQCEDLHLLTSDPAIARYEVALFDRQ